MSNEVTEAVRYSRFSNDAFEAFCDVDGEELPPNDIDAMQVELCRWQRRNFGNVSPIDKVDVHMGLGVIEEYCEALTAKTIHGDKGMLDGLGDTCIYAGQLLIFNRMALRPLMEFADAMLEDWDAREEWPDDISLPGLFAHIVLKHDQKIRGLESDAIYRAELAHKLASMFAYLKRSIMDTASEILEVGERTLDGDGLIQRTYIEVGASVVLKRDWTVNRLTGKSP